MRRESRDPLELLVSRFVFTPIQQISAFSVSGNIAYPIVLCPAWKRQHSYSTVTSSSFIFAFYNIIHSASVA